MTDSAQRPSMDTSIRQDPTAEAPGVPSIIPNDPDGLLDASAIHEEILITIPKWGDNTSPDSEILWVEWALADDPDQQYELEVKEIPPGTVFPLNIQVPRSKYLQGKLLVSYRYLNIDLNPFQSHPTTITVDTLPPYGNESPESLIPPTWAPGQEGVITDAVLDANGGKLVYTVPTDYTDYSPDDTVHFYWIKNVPDDPADLPPSSVPPFKLGDTDEIAVDRDILQAVGDGQCTGVYVLVDKAGNISRISWWDVATVAMGPLPANMLAPVIPAAADGTVNRLDAHNGVVVEIPAFDNAKNGDLVHAKWGNTPLPTFPTGPTPEFPLRIHVPWSALEANYDYDGEAPLQEVEVSYQVSRAGLTFPEVPPATKVNVYLRVVGPDKPDPDPVNPGLPNALVKGDSGIDNKLVETDADKDAEATFLLYANAKLGDQVQLFWGGVAVPDLYYVGNDDEPGVTVVTIPIKWPLIAEVGNNLALPVYYRITDAEQVNYQQSPTTNVEVRAVQVTLLAPEFPHLYTSPENGRKILNCSSIRKEGDDHGFWVHVAPNAYLKAGMEVTMDWVVTENLDGTGAIDGTELTAHITLSSDQALNGIDWFVHPYAEKILPAFEETAARRGYTRMKYSAPIGGFPVESQIATETIGLLGNGDNSCPLP